MSDDPFEFSPELFGKIPLFAELGKVLAWQGGPVNWDIARQFATALAGQGTPTGVMPGAAEEAADALRLAEAWILAATGLPEPAVSARPAAMTQSQWADHAPGSYRELIDPLARRIAGALEPPGDGAGSQEQMLGEAIKKMAPLFLGIQSGVVLGTLARDVLSQYDLPFPPAEDGAVIVVTPAVDRFASAYGLDRREALQWVALHETAHRIQIDGLPWVRTHFYALYHDYVSSLHFDLGSIMDRLQSMDMTSPEQMQAALGDHGLIGMQDSPAVEEALARLHSFIAVLEASADRIAAAGGAGKLSGATRIAEAARRRVAEGDGGVRLFRQFVGIDLDDTLRREAAAFLVDVEAEGGWPLLNRMWDEPALLPTSAEIRDSAAWLRRVRPGP